MFTQVTSCSIGTATKPGDNFVGVIFRAAVTFVTRGAEKKDSLILKIEPFLEGMKKEMMANQPFFDTEYRMYSQVLPAMQDLLKNSGDPEIIAPEYVRGFCFYRHKVKHSKRLNCSVLSFPRSFSSTPQ